MRVPVPAAVARPAYKKFKPLAPSSSAAAAAPSLQTFTTPNPVERVQPHERERAKERAEGTVGARAEWDRGVARDKNEDSNERENNPPVPSASAAEKQPPRKSEPPLFAPEDDDDSSAAGDHDVKMNGLEAPRPSQRRGLGDVPVDLTNSSGTKRKALEENVDQIESEDDLMIIEPPMVDKGKGKQIDNDPPPPSPPKVTVPRKTVGLVPRKQVDEQPNETRYFLVRFSCLNLLT